MENTIRLEAKIENMDKHLCQVLEEIKELKAEMLSFRDSRFQLNIRVENLEKKAECLEESLKGNVTTKMLKQWIVGAASVMSAVVVLSHMLLKLLK